jgi:chromosome partitioning protein
MAALRIALYNGKGGCGKTTLAWNLAMGLARRAPTLLVDADPQGSLGDWANWADSEGHYAIAVCDWAALREGGQAEHHYRVYDCPPRLDDHEIQGILGQADLVLLPVLPSPLDLWASRRSAELVQDLQLRGCFVLNQVEAHSALSRASQSAIAAMGLPVLPVAIGRRAIYRSAALEGLSVYHMGKRAGAARDEIERLIEEILK